MVREVPAIVGSRRTSPESPLLAFFGHHRCATTWLSQRILKQVARELKLHWAYLFSPRQLGGDPARYVREEGIELLCYVNAQREHVERLPDHLGFHVVRDPRDVLVSSYFAHLHSHPTDFWPELPAHRERLRALDEGDGLMAEMDFTERLQTAGLPLRPFDALASWRYDQPNVLELRFEDLASDPLEGVTSALTHLGLVGQAPARLSGRGVRRLVERNAFNRVTGGRPRGEEDVQHHYRRGVPGDWERHFEERHKSVFKERWGELLIQLGYAADLSW